MGPRRSLGKNDKPQFINQIGINENHSCFHKSRRLNLPPKRVCGLGAPIIGVEPESFGSSGRIRTRGLTG
jgi:hypothetical protein